MFKRISFKERKYIHAIHARTIYKYILLHTNTHKKGNTKCIYASKAFSPFNILSIHMV